jgi:hypothetical protein
MGQDFVGIAFHRQDDNTYEGVYLRPFNFRAKDPARRQHAVQYIKHPEYGWDTLRERSPEEFENPVDSSVVPTDWVRLRVVVAGSTVQVYVGPNSGNVPAHYTAALEIRKLGQLQSGQVGLYVDNGGGDFANLMVTPAN